MRRQAKAIVAISAMLLTFALSVSSASAAPPVVSIDSSSTAQYVTAQVSGEVDPKDIGTWWSFETSSDGGGSWSGFGFQGFAEENTGLQPVNLELTGLKPGTTYQVRLVANNFSDPEVISAVETFETKAVAKPTVTLDPASAITGDSAHLQGTVNPHGTDDAFNSSCFFEYMTDAAYQARDEVQRVRIRASGGAFTLEHQGQVTGPIAFNASAATVQGALEALSSLDPGDVSVSGGPGNLTGSSPYIITFADTDAGELYAEAANLTGPGKAQLVTVVNGFSGQNEVQQLTISATAGAFSLSYDGQPTAAIPYDASAATLESALEALAAIGAGNIEVSGGPGDASGSNPYTITFAGDLANGNRKQLVANIATLTNSGQGEVATLTQGHDEGFGGATSVPCLPNEEQVKGNGASPVQLDLEDIEPGTAYHVRLRAENAGGVSIVERTFSTPDLGPGVSTAGANSTTDTSARLAGYLDPENKPTAYHFEWGLQPNLAGAQSLPPSEDGDGGSGNGWNPVGKDLTGLQPSTTYYFRLVASNGVGGEVEGAIHSFTTYPTPAPENQNCPNAAIRAQQDSQHLPECRAYELVNAPNLGGASASTARLSDDSNRALYTTTGPAPGSGGGVTGLFFSARTATGWSASTVNPDRVGNKYRFMYPVAISPDLSKIVTTGGVKSIDFTDMLRLDPASLASLETVHTFGGFGPSSYPSLRVFGSDDLKRVFIFPNAPLGPDFPQWTILEIGTGVPVVVSILPDGSPAGCPGWLGQGRMVKLHPVSTSGDRFFFSAETTSGECNSSQRGVFMRKAGPDRDFSSPLATTVRLDTPAPGEPEPGRDPTFVSATPDGSEVFFISGANLTGDSDDDGGGLYRYDVASGQRTCLTCVTSVPSEVREAFVAENGDRAYFVSTRALAPGAVKGERNLYFVAGNALRFVTVYRGEFADEVLLTPDGASVVFNRFEAGLDTRTGTDSGGHVQVYRYNAARDQLDCVSCLPEGVATASGRADIPWLMDSDASRSISDDGQMIVFSTAVSLDPADVNGLIDIYRWREGRPLALLTDGINPNVSSAYMQGMSPDGSSVLFGVNTKLTDEVLSASPSAQLYVARVNGGFQLPNLPTPCAGDACHGAPTPAPAADSPGTAQFSGPGNQPAAKPCAKGKARKQGRCVSKKPKKKKQAKKKARKGAKRGGAK